MAGVTRFGAMAAAASAAFAPTDAASGMRELSTLLALAANLHAEAEPAQVPSPTHPPSHSRPALTFVLHASPCHAPVMHPNPNPIMHLSWHLWPACVWCGGRQRVAMVARLSATGPGGATVLAYIAAHPTVEEETL